MSIFIWNISDHYRRPTVGFYLLQVDIKVFGFFCANGSAISDWSWTFHHIIIILLRDDLHHDRHGVVVGGVHAVNLRLFCVDPRCIPCGDGVGAVLCVFSDNSHAGVDNIVDLLILLLIFRRVAGGLIVFMFSVVMVLILQKQEFIIEGLMTIGCDFSFVFAGNPELREGCLLLLFLFSELGSD